MVPNEKTEKKKDAIDVIMWSMLKSMWSMLKSMWPRGNATIHPKHLTPKMPRFPTKGAFEDHADFIFGIGVGQGEGDQIFAVLLVRHFHRYLKTSNIQKNVSIDPYSSLY